MKRLRPFLHDHFCFPVKLIFKFAMGVLSLLIPLGLAARVVINEVYYDHPGRDDGWEFIELYNKGKVKFDLSGLWLEFVDGRTGKARIVWSSTEGLVLGPGVYLVVAGSNRHPPPECILSGSLENGPDAVRLVSVGLVH
ncbi:MAG: lamin tail domain-containing protein, partial [Candidatus Krumholzibacteria bacterium]|nr:lamin tail domain-containing protein [Candidatus Krumholzibacteria bacterium]